MESGPKRRASFIKVTSKSLHRLDNIDSHDQTNVTITNRTIYDYNSHLGLDAGLIDTIKELSKKLKRPLVILDVGCGQGTALEQILSYKTLEPYVKRCIGISKHYFSPIKQIFHNHGKRFEFHLGDALEILVKPDIKADLILDVWGALSYSIDKTKLIRLYHQALTPNGQAYIMQNREVTVKRNQQDSKRDLFDELEIMAPDQIKRQKDTDTLCITKSGERLILPTYSLLKHKQKSTIGDEHELSKAELKRGNAIAPNHVVLKASATPSRKLRPRPYTKFSGI